MILCDKKPSCCSECDYLSYQLTGVNRSYGALTKTSLFANNETQFVIDVEIIQKQVCNLTGMYLETDSYKCCPLLSITDILRKLIRQEIENQWAKE